VLYRSGLARSDGLLTHISAGLAIISLLLARILWRVMDPAPPFELTPLGIWSRSAAKLTHFVLYALLAATPIVGILVQFARGDALPVFGVFEIASPWVKDREFAGSLKDVHETLANALMVVALVHTTAALAHHWILRDRTLIRMLPSSQ